MMTIEETDDLEVMTELINHPDVRDVMGFRQHVPFDVIWREGMTMLVFRDDVGKALGCIWLDMLDEAGVSTPFAHVAFTRAIRGRDALKAISGAINWCFLNRDWQEIWAKAPFRRSHLLLKHLGWEDIREEVEQSEILGEIRRKVIRLKRQWWWERIAHRPFFVTGFPRSGTAWIANLLTNSGSLCIHEIGQFGAGADIWLYSGENRGTSDPSILVTSTLIQDNRDAPVVWIRRDRDEAEASFVKYSSKLGAVITPEQIHELFDKIEMAAACALVGRENVIVVDFKNLFTVESAERIWKHCLPKLPFDKTRAKILCGFNVQQDLIRSWNRNTPNPIEAEPERPRLTAGKDRWHDGSEVGFHKDRF